MVNEDKTTTVTESSQDHRDEECISYDTATTRETTTGDGSTRSRTEVVGRDSSHPDRPGRETAMSP
jgi:hypothetical protein